MRRSSTLLTRLALAVLAALGFVAPLATPEVDRVVQTVAGRSSEPRRLELAAAAVLRAEPRPSAPVASAAEPVPPRAERRRRYLLHRAWLI